MDRFFVIVWPAWQGLSRGCETEVEEEELVSMSGVSIEGPSCFASMASWQSSATKKKLDKFETTAEKKEFKTRAMKKLETRLRGRFRPRCMPTRRRRRRRSCPGGPGGRERSPIFLLPLNFKILVKKKEN